jgi:uncharacterized protein YmfQ (DUF2313 family)
MADALFSATDYVDALAMLFPRGRAWPMAPGTVQRQVLEALAAGLTRFDARAQTLLVDAFPGATIELLPEWEATTALPDPCDGDGQTVDQRRAQVINRLVSAGGQSVPYFLGVLTRLGYTGAQIVEYAPFRADVGCADQPLYTDPWAFHWTIVLPGLSVFYFQADVSAADEPLFTVSDQAVLCTIATLQPSHTTVDFQTA